MKSVLLAALCALAAPAAAATSPFFVFDNGLRGEHTQTIPAQLDLVQEVGFAGLAWRTDTLERVQEVLAGSRQRGLKLFVLYANLDLKDGRMVYDPRLREIIKLCRGHDVMIWPNITSKQFKLSDPTGDEIAVAGLHELADLCAAQGLRIALYPHANLWLHRVEDALRVVKKVNRQNVGLTFNLCHALIDGAEDRIPALITEAAPHLFVATINGADRGAGPKEMSRIIQPLDQGTYDVGVVLRQLQTVGFTGPIGLQCYNIKGDPHTLLTGSMAAWRRLTGTEEKKGGGPTGQAGSQSASSSWQITPSERRVEITAGILSRTIDLADDHISTRRLGIGGQNGLAEPAREFSVTVSIAEPNRKPAGLAQAEAPPLNTTTLFSPGANSIGAGREPDAGMRWIDPVRLTAHSWSAQFALTSRQVTRPAATTQRLTVQARARPETPLAGLEISLCYEIYAGFPVIRKWVEITQRGPRWLKLEDLVIDDLALAASCRERTLLTPDERGAGSSVVAFGHPNGEYGVIAVSEIPSALRQIQSHGAMGYAGTWFEWVLGPGETFVSEPVFHFAWQGALVPTASAISTPLDRAVEGPYLDFLRRHVGVAADTRAIAAPQWCTWTHFKQNLTDALVREQAAIAARCGFGLILLDQGWQRGLVGTEPDPAKFNDLGATSRALQELGLEVGLWVSCYRSAGSPDLRAMPAGRSLPLLTRDGGFGMSFASAWRDFYAEDLAEVSRRYGIRYFKQDFTNLKFGDIAEGHESRSKKESLLRSLRGLLAAQDRLRALRPEVTTEITHEIYWGTPGVPCDVAVLKHAAAYHIPPNDYAGAGPTTGRVRQDAPVDVAKLQAQLRAGAWNARHRVFAHRGLPLYAIEYYAAHAVNIGGSLTPALQDRQICSWLMGVPAVFAGDLASLTPENIAHYRRRFDLVKRLERDHGIYRRFQFSGVPGPTDEDWHWWGKLDAQGGGAVVVLRGSGGATERAVNVPWVQEDQTYTVHAQLGDRQLGRFTGRQLQAGVLHLALPVLGQEILELRLAP